MAIERDHEVSYKQYIGPYITFGVLDGVKVSGFKSFLVAMHGAKFVCVP